MLQSQVFNWKARWSQSVQRSVTARKTFPAPVCAHRFKTTRASMTLQFDVGDSTIAHMSMIDCMFFCGRVRILSGACPSFDWPAACCTHGTRSAS